MHHISLAQKLKRTIAVQQEAVKKYNNTRSLGFL